MLQLIGKKFRCCDGISRRSMLKAGFLGLGGLTLPDLLRLRAQAASDGRSMPKSSVIFVELAGGPTHIDTYDPKPQAPIEFRGPFSYVQTNVPGVIFSALMKEQAKVMDRMAIIRSITHDSSSHRTSAHLTQTGYYLRDRQNRENEMPAAGSITNVSRGANARGIPAYVAIPQPMRFGNAAYLGKQYNPLATAGDPNKSDFEVKNLSLLDALDLGRLDARRTLLASLDRQKHLVDLGGVVEAYDGYTDQAFEMVAGAQARQAFDIQREPDRMRDRYGRSTEGQSLLLARRLVEAGVTFVTVRLGGWDMHGNIERAMKQRGPVLDQGLAALIGDLGERGMNRDVLIVAMGEFGRTPRVNKNAGRDHWGSLMSVMLSGGNYKMGQVIGASNSKGEVPSDNPYRPENVLEMVYRHLGIDSQTTFPDLSGRPRYVLENRKPIVELI